METNSPKYWLSLEQWRQDPEFARLAEKEFLSSPLQESDGKDGWARREFLKLMGASLALSSFGCIRRPAQMIVPYAKKPTEVLHGLANYYASAFVDGDDALGILVTTRDGRPVKIEGNPDHPANRGGMSARAHAHILSLYDPDRLTGPQRNLLNEKKTNRETVKATFEVMDREIIDSLKKGGVGILMPPSFSPSTQVLVRDFAETYNARIFQWEALGSGDAVEAARASFGREVVPSYRFDKARLIVAVGSDFLGTQGMTTRNQLNFGKARRPGKEMARLVAFESLVSLTGTNADERFRIPAGREVAVLMGLVRHLVGVKKVSRYANDGAVGTALKNFTDDSGVSAAVLGRIADELWENRGKSVVVAGSWAQSADSVAVHTVANLLNSILENDGATVDFGRGVGTAVGLNSLMEVLNKGEIKTLIIHGVNPGYAAVTSGFAEAVKKAKMVIYTGDRVDETGVFADFIIPDHHALENWGDMEALAGAYTVQQPTIRPLYDTRAFQDSLLVWIKGSGGGSARARSAANWYEYLRENWRAAIYGGNRGRGPATKGFDEFWEDVLHTGVFETAPDRQPGGAGSFNTGSLAAIKNTQPAGGYTLQLYSTVGLRDGSLANVSWLQEFPDPVTKICWDNYLTVSPADAMKEKWKEGDMVALKSGATELQLPIHIQPGQADSVVGLAVGYGRSHAGKIANGVGQNAFQLMRWQQGRAVASGLDVSLKKTGKRYDLACVQGHHSMEGRQIVVEATLAQFMENPEANIHRHQIFSMWSDVKFPGNKWGMVIDLNQCTGCGACIIACQSENNVPAVGKRHVLMGREMHWLRIDRYYVGDPNDPAVVHQPIVCMHCDNAPCETVCPVMATAHSDEGTNDMIYNRCVGTRYCSNNCPYKVRRFNWFNFVKPIEKPLNYAMNPDVTVRARGVMEKCTFCIHRIRSVKSQTKLHDRQLKDGDIKTACQQSCPTQAIVFGDLNDTESQVRQLFDQKNSYALLEELNTQPAVRYQSKVRNAEALKGGHGHGHGEKEKGGHS